MNKRILWMFAVAVTVFAFSLNTLAQPQGGPRGPGGGMGPGMGPGGGMGPGMGGAGMIFQNPEFVKVLDLTPEQAADLQRIVRESGEEIRRQMQGAMQQGGGPPNFGQMRQQMEQFFDGAQAKVDQVLKPEQRTKLRDVTFQLTGGLESPMMGERTLQTLGMTESQKEKFREVMAARDRENQAAMQGFDFFNATAAEREKFRADMEARGKKYAEQVTVLLTPEQKEKVLRLTNEAPALREKLGMPAQGPGQQRGQGPQGGRGPGPGGGYTPGPNSWQPGQELPTSPAPPQGGQRRGGFPRSE